MTYSYSLNGEHATTINGEGQNPGLQEIMEVAENIGIKKAKAKAVEIHDCVQEMLGVYLSR